MSDHKPRLFGSDESENDNHSSNSDIEHDQ